jgi:hypothetical protein
VIRRFITVELDLSASVLRNVFMNKLSTTGFIGLEYIINEASERTMFSLWLVGGSAF